MPGFTQQAFTAASTEQGELNAESARLGEHRRGSFNSVTRYHFELDAMEWERIDAELNEFRGLPSDPNAGSAPLATKH